MTDSLDIENRAGIARTTCGWRKAELDRDAVRNYWRDVHSPAIARREGVYWYRHSPFDAVRSDLFAPVAGIEFDCAADNQLMWQSDVVYFDDAGLKTFMGSPGDPEVTALLLGDIEMIVDKSTTYLSLDRNMKTFVDRTDEPVQIGPRTNPTFGLFFKQRGTQEEFRAALTGLAERWSALPNVLRLRLNLFEVPDMEAERKAGYPVKTHPVQMQYQAWMDLVLDDDTAAASMLQGENDVSAAVSTIHAYPVPAIYTFVYNGAPTLIGLRGYAAKLAIDGLNADHATDPRLLTWMYGDIVAGSAAVEALV